MSRQIKCTVVLTGLILTAVGCGSSKPSAPPATENQTHGHSGHATEHDRETQAANLAKLSLDDRALAEAQGYCAVTEEALGSMGPPLKLMVGETPVFVCCKGCQKKALASPDATLAKLENLKAQVRSESESRTSTTPTDHGGHLHEHPTTSPVRDPLNDHSEHGRHNPAAPIVLRQLIVQTEPQVPQANSPTRLVLEIKENGTPITKFQRLHEKLLHLIVVREGLDEFAHLHPDVDNAGKFSSEFVFPQSGKYRLFADHQPDGQSPGLAVGEVVVAGESTAAQPLQVNLPGEVVIDDAKARISLAGGGLDTKVTFELLDSTNQPINDLEPYLGAMGHLVIISENGRDYVHAHPLSEATTAPDGKVEFEAHFAQPGLYKLWGQFQRMGQVFTVPGVLKHESAGHAHGGVGMGPGMMAGRRGMGMGMMGGPAMGGMANMRQDMMGLMSLLDAKDGISRTIRDLPNGVETITESDDEAVRKLIREHVTAMYRRLEKNEPMPMMTRDPLFVEVFKHAKQINLKTEETATGLKVIETSDDPYVAKLIQSHARVVDAFIANGMEEVHREHAVPQRSESSPNK